MLKNNQTYFHNLAVFTIQDFDSVFGHFPTLCIKALSSISFKTSPQCASKNMRCFGKFRDLKNNVKNTHGGILLLVQLQGEACIFVKNKTPPWVFFSRFLNYTKLLKLYSNGTKLLKASP